MPHLLVPEVGTKRWSEGGIQRIEGDDKGHTQGQRPRVQGKKRRVESSKQGTVVWEVIQDKLKTQDNSSHNLWNSIQEEGQGQFKEMQDTHK
jgi:hypothetical protein